MQILYNNLRQLFFITIICFFLASCVQSRNNALGLVTDEDTGLKYGSFVSNSITTDPSFFKNPRIKIRLRNTSGDLAFNLNGLRAAIENDLNNAGYFVTHDDDFGLLLDVNVLHSGHLQNNYSSDLAFLGGATGGVIGARNSNGSTANTLGGVVAGATIGGILGSFIKEDTYMIATNVKFSVVRNSKKRDGRTVVFSRSTLGHQEDEEDRIERQTARGIKSTAQVNIAVYAGGINVKQSEISSEVRARIGRIIGNII